MSTPDDVRRIDDAPLAAGRVYRLTEEWRQRVLKASRWRTLFIALVLPFLVSAPCLYLWRSQSRPDMIQPLVLAWVTCPVIAAYQWRRSGQRTHAMLEAFTLEAEPGALTRRLRGYPDLRIPREEVTAIEVTSHGDLVIHMTRNAVFMGVPRELDGYEELRRALSMWGEIRPARPRRLGGYAISLVFFVGFSMLLLTSNPRVLLAVSGILLVTGVTVCVSLLRSRQVPTRKWPLVLFLMLPLITIVVTFGMALYRLFAGE